jgi:cytochrome P450
VAAEHFLQLDLAGRVFNESLRIYPPTWIIVRVAVRDDKLPGGTAIKAGDKIWLSPYTMHRHPGIYENPESFDPERWLPEAARLRPRLGFFPFGAGSKLCIGEPFARLESMVIITRLAQRFWLEPVYRGKVKLRPSIVLEPHGGLTIRLRQN